MGPCRCLALAVLGVGIEFVPMLWGSSTVARSLPSGSRYVLGFNQPNFHAQSNFAAEETAR
jgi:hypothetical protein